MCNKKKCKICNEDKIITEDFYYNSNTGYYNNYCKICINKIKSNRKDNRKKKNITEIPYIYKKRILGKTKTCIKCNIEKDLTEENFLIRNKKFSNTCKKCYENFITENKRTKDNYLKEGTADKNLKYLVNRKYSVYRIEDFNKGREFGLTKEFLEDSLLSKCIYCSYPATGLDRLNNSIGHTDKNCVPCCTQCNLAKSNYFTYEDMLKIGKVIQEIKLSRNL